MTMFKKKYLRYTAPEGWSFHDVCTFRPDIMVKWVFVDKRNLTRIMVEGVWKGYYDCDLDIFEVVSPVPYVPVEKEIEQ
jgi:hypothetical protein